ncbi:MAG TPA: DNA polymerase IV [Candidatus Binatia bacterium]|nr:DNA polymerase IV [Candidatus Binatia bacterium]
MVGPALAGTVLHVDMDAFYAAIEQRDRPELRGRPVVVGALPGGRGVVSAASYEARPFGVRSAMPISRAVRLCPHAAYLPVDRDKYARVSREVMAILAEFTPLVEPMSIDEAFLDITESQRLFGDGPTVARQIKGRIRAELALTASVGVAANKFVAKVASDLGKPDGLVVVEAGAEAEFLAPLPVARLWGVGQATARLLEALGIRTIGQLAAWPDDALRRRLGNAGPALRALAIGHDERPVESWGAPKSMGAEETFETDHLDLALLETTLRRQAERVARELRAEGCLGRTVTLKIRFSDFTTLTRRHTGEPTQDGLRIYRDACRLLDGVPLRRSVRLIGLSVSGLAPTDRGQLSLLDPTALRRERLARALDRIEDRFGAGAVTPASLLARRSGRGEDPA